MCNVACCVIPWTQPFQARGGRGWGNCDVRVIKSANGQLETVIQRVHGDLPSVVVLSARGGVGAVTWWDTADVCVRRIEIGISVWRFSCHCDPRTDESQLLLIGFESKNTETTAVVPSVPCLKAENLVLTLFSGADLFRIIRSASDVGKTVDGNRCE